VRRLKGFQIRNKKPAVRRSRVRSTALLSNLVVLALASAFVWTSAPSYANEALNRKHGSTLVSDLQAFAKSDRRVFKIDRGDYIIGVGSGAFHISLKGFKGKKIIGNGARLIFSDPRKGGMLISGSHDLTLEGLELDWLVKPYVIVNVEALSFESQGSATVRVAPLPGFADSVSNLQHAEFTWATAHNADGTRRLLPVRDVMWFKVTAPNSLAELVLKASGESAKTARHLRINDRLVILARHGGTHAIQIAESHDISLEGLVLRSSPAMGILALPGSSNITVERCVIQPRNRDWISLNADGIHLIGTGGRNVVRNNVLEGLQDDAIVVSERGAWGTVEKTTIRFRDDGTIRLSKAAQLLVVPEVGPLDRVSSSAMTRAPDGSLTVSLNARLPQRMRVAVLPTPRQESSVVVEQNRIGNIRGSAVRVSRSDVTVRNNTVDLTIEQAITVGAWLLSVWHPQAPAQNVEVTGNRITQPTLDPRFRDRRGQIEIGCWPMTWCTGRTLNRGVRVADNEFIGGTGYARHSQFVLPEGLGTNASGN